MKPSQLVTFLKFGIQNKLNILIKGKPGIGKTDTVFQACRELNDMELILSHPSVSDPTDYKGLPFPSPDGKEALFLPFGNLNKLIKADKPTVFFLDDLGQAPASVQAAVMQLLLAREIDGHKISDHVAFVAATNRREDKANVNGLLEPVKSRFASIVELNIETNDWVKWAIQNNMPTELISFIRYRPELLEKFEATKEIENTPTPRTVANVGKMQNAGLIKEIEFEAIKGAAGEAFAAEYTGFLKIFRDLPSIDGIIMAPENAMIPKEPATLAALAGALGARTNEQTIGAIIKYCNRLPGEIGVATIKDGLVRCPKITDTRAFIVWASENADVIL